MNNWQRIATALAAATAIALPAEGLRQAVYRDSGGVMTQCAGDTHRVDPTRIKSREECLQLLDEQMLSAIEQVERCVQPPLPWQALAAWSDAVFNLGPTIVCDVERSTAARLLRDGKRLEACHELPKWSKARIPGLGLTTLPGLVKRRERERALCVQGFA